MIEKFSKKDSLSAWEKIEKQLNNNGIETYFQRYSGNKDREKFTNSSYMIGATIRFLKGDNAIVVLCTEKSNFLLKWFNIIEDSIAKRIERELKRYHLGEGKFKLNSDIDAVNAFSKMHSVIIGYVK